MTPAEKLAATIVKGLAVTAEQFGKVLEETDRIRLERSIAEAIQLVADEQCQQSDAQAFGDDLEVTTQGLEQCECMKPAGVTVTIAPLFQEPNGLN